MQLPATISLLFAAAAAGPSSMHARSIAQPANDLQAARADLARCIETKPALLQPKGPVMGEWAFELAATFETIDDVNKALAECRAC
ncbi:hypothetical protein HIM_08757 [Hirsutella minnesotensis 3608]|uniref:Uncharacterized protein n=1 Tax=Hirsutella minnesotensis 3608 TaxID=1043627 RepID=A0A0F8A3H3_9HYPO|nr:hypothetical protein HIM_08757 [Hirsutella minnesotensis 3608]